ncbi:NAD-dependent epimerase/dehydratase family protein [Deinococcus sp.]|uniref:NAD-dependent epimerase/dehydratase family protein n=1 Tax=Deinococcus sp. TaxID=47478 RepID=UPI003B5A3686
MNLPLSAKIFLAYPPGAPRDALVERLIEWGYYNLVMGETLDLRDRDAVLAFFERELPDYVFYLTAQLEPGHAPPPAQWLYDNLRSVTHLADAAYLYDVSKLLCLDASAALLEDVALVPATSQAQAAHTWNSEALEELRYASTVTRRATSELCDSYRRQYNCNFISAVTTSIYGPGVLNGPGSSLVPSLLEVLRRAQAEDVSLLRLRGHPQERHHLLHLDDLTDATLYMMARVSQPGTVYLGLAQGCTLGDVVGVLAGATGYRGRFEFEPRPSLPAPALSGETEQWLEKLSWQASVPLLDGLTGTARWHAQESHLATLAGR